MTNDQQASAQLVVLKGDLMAADIERKNLAADLDEARKELADALATERRLRHEAEQKTEELIRASARCTCASRQDLRVSNETAPSARPQCKNFCPPTYSGPWRDWHRGHGCHLDDGRKPR